jgi:glyoxylase-like metal-dependent hydrolase (beta-lactamase superfamily II)
MAGCGCHGASLLYAALSRRQALRAAGVVAGGVAATLALRDAAWAGPALQVPPPTLEQLAEDAYLWRDSGYNKLFVVTDAGVIATDPSAEQSPAVADRYKAAIASVTSQPVRYLVYSHEHADHSYGGDVFADTAQFVGHRLAAPKMAARNEPRNPPPTVLGG